MDIFKMANELANNMSDEDNKNMEGLDMEKMISTVTKSVFGMMKDFNIEGVEGGENPHLAEDKSSKDKSKANLNKDPVNQNFHQDWLKYLNLKLEI